MKFYQVSILLILVFSFVTVSCSSKIEGSGNIETVVREVEGFSAIKVSGSMNFNYVKSNKSVCEIEADSNLLDNIKTEVDGEMLNVYADQSYTAKHGVLVTCSSKSVGSVVLTGSGEFKAHDFRNKSLNLAVFGSGEIHVNQIAVDSLNLSVAGSGDIFVSGTADNLNASISGSGDVKAKSLMVKNSNLKVTGSGSIYSATSNNVSASITGSGDVVIFGEPKSISKNVVGSGNIKVIEI